MKSLAVELLFALAPLASLRPMVAHGDATGADPGQRRLHAQPCQATAPRRASPPAARWGRRLLGTAVLSARSLADAHARLRRRRATHQALAELDDRTLRDLGIDRSELGSIASGAGAGDRRRQSAHWVT